MLTLQKSLMRLAQQAPLFKPPEEALQWGFRQTEEASLKSMLWSRCEIGASVGIVRDGRIHRRATHASHRVSYPPASLCFY